MAFGFMMLAMSCVCTYLYFMYIRPKQLADHPRSSGSLARESARIQSVVASKKPQTLSNLAVGSFIKISDIGLNLSEIDGRLIGKNLFKSGLTRWYELIIDDGAKHTKISYLPPGGESSSYLTLYQARISDLGLQADDFRSIESGFPKAVKFEGSHFNLVSSIAAQYCADADELHPKPCLLWDYLDESGLQMLSIIRLHDHRLQVYSKTRISESQISFLSAPT